MSSSSEPKLGLFIPLTAKAAEASAVNDFLLSGYDLVQDTHEPSTLQWFALKYAKPAGNGFAIFDTFAAESGCDAHLQGAVAAALQQNRDRLLVQGDEGVQIRKVDILASKVEKPADGLTKGLQVGLRILLKAKESKIQAVKEFLEGALPIIQQETFTPVWYAIHFPGTNEFGIIDFFTAEEGRQQHLVGNVAKALLASADELLDAPLDIVEVDVLAAKL